MDEKIGKTFYLYRGTVLYVFDNPLDFASYNRCVVNVSYCMCTNSIACVDKEGNSISVNHKKIAIPVYSLYGQLGMLYFQDIFDFDNRINSEYNWVLWSQGGYMCAEMNAARIGIDIFCCKDEVDLSHYSNNELSLSQIEDIAKKILEKSPNLMRQTCMGSAEKGIDKDGNWFSGKYILNDGNTYEITRCRGSVFVKLNKDKILDFDIDINKLKNDKIKASLRRKFIEDFTAISRSKKLEDALFELYKDCDEFKLSSDYVD